jgi:phage-related baseplate assembly protein
MKLADLPDIDFVDINADVVEKSLFTAYTNITGRTLSRADPVRLFILFVADVVIRLLNNINHTGKQNLLKYSEGHNLDNLAANAWVTRIPASAATTTLEVSLATERAAETIVPAGTRVSPESNVYFATDTALIIPAWSTKGTVSATCTAVGTVGNDYNPGEISQIVDPVPYVESVVNVTRSEGGADEEKDDALRERVWEAPEALSVAGPVGAYKARTKAVNASIADVYVDSPSPGVVRVVPLLTDGGIPGAEILSEVLTALSADNVRPLTDNVSVVAPEAISYAITAEYYIDTDADPVTVQTHVSEAVAEYASWQKARLGRDIVPSKLIQLIMSVSGVHRVNVVSPSYTVVEGTQVAKADTISVVMSGSEPE